MRDGSRGPKSQSPLEVEVLAMERTDKTGEDLGREARGVWKPLTIRLEDIEGRQKTVPSLAIFTTQWEMFARSHSIDANREQCRLRKGSHSIPNNSFHRPA
jgi:hypothetical protein